MRSHLPVATFCLASLLTAACAVAQPCPWTWFSDGPRAETSADSPDQSSHIERMLTWDPDGPGPLAPRVVFAGRFNRAGNDGSTPLAYVDPATGWLRGFPRDLYPVLFYSVMWLRDISVGPDNQIYACGKDFREGPQAPLPIRNVARFDGSRWHPLDAGTGGDTHALHFMPDGSLIAGGEFISSAGNAVSRWDGEAWSPVGVGLTGGPVRALTSTPDGTLWAAGDFTHLGDGTPAPRLARWDGTAWQPVIDPAGPLAATSVQALHPLPDNSVLLGGSITAAGAVTAPGAVIWNGSAFIPAGLNAPTDVKDFSTRHSGQILASTPAGVFFLENGLWTAFASSPAISQRVYTAHEFNPGEVYLGMDQAMRLVRSGQFIVPQSAVDDRIESAARLGDGTLYISGMFQYAGEAFAEGFAKLDPVTNRWKRVGDPSPVFRRPREMLTMPDGRLLGVGRYYSVALNRVVYAALWDGVQWTPFDNGIDTELQDLTLLADGRVVAYPSYSNFRPFILVDGLWQPAAPFFGLVDTPQGVFKSIRSLPNGEYIATGPMTTTQGVTISKLARTVNGQWVDMSAGINVKDVNVSPAGVIRIIHTFPFPPAPFRLPEIREWDGTRWSVIGSGGFNKLVTLENEDLIALGGFNSIQTASGATIQTQNIARYSDGQWSDVGRGIGFGTDDWARRTGPTEVTFYGSISFVDQLPSYSIGILNISCQTVCDSIDFNNNLVFPEDQDVIDFFDVLAGAECPTCNDIDFNNNDVFPEEEDIIAFFRVLAGGNCTE